MIENIFEFNNQSAEDIMIHRTDMEVIWLDDSPEQILARIEETGLSRFPVCEEDADDVKGILNTRDYLINAQKEQPLPLGRAAAPGLLRARISADGYFIPQYAEHQNAYGHRGRRIRRHQRPGYYGGPSGADRRQYLRRV